MSVLWSLEPATEAKHRLYKRYFDAWCQSCCSRLPRATGARG